MRFLCGNHFGAGTQGTVVLMRKGIAMYEWSWRKVIFVPNKGSVSSQGAIPWQKRQPFPFANREQTPGDHTMIPPIAGSVSKEHSESRTIQTLELFFTILMKILTRLSETVPNWDMLHSTQWLPVCGEVSLSGLLMQTV